MTSDYRTIVRWARTEGEGDERGDAVASYAEAETLTVGFVPSSESLTPTDAGTDGSAERWRVFVSYTPVFKPGDRLGPVGSDADMEVVTARTFTWDQILEVRPI